MALMLFILQVIGEVWAGGGYRRLYLLVVLIGLLTVLVFAILGIG